MDSMKRDSVKDSPGIQSAYPGAFAILIRCNYKHAAPEERVEEEYMIRAAVIQAMRVRGHSFSISAPGSALTDIREIRDLAAAPGGTTPEETI